MIPLNKPMINNSRRKESLDNFIQTQFNNRYYHLTFSARQGLSEIYQKIKLEKGSQTVVVSPLTCVEAIYPIIENGHNIQFVDIDRETLNMDESLIPLNIDIVQAIHFGGNPQNMNLILEKNPSIIVEDCAQGFGSYYLDQQIGMFGDYAAFSFMKNIYSLGGGLVLSKSDLLKYKIFYKKISFLPTLYRYLKRLFENGCNANSNIFYFFLQVILKLKPENTSLVLNNSSNNKLITRSIEKQLVLYSEIIKKRTSVAKFLLKNIQNQNINPQKITGNSSSNYLRLFFILKNRSTKEVIGNLRKFGIGANHLTQNFNNPYQIRFDQNIHLKKFVIRDNLPNYFNLHDSIISIPISPSLKKEDLIYMVNHINKI